MIVDPVLLVLAAAAYLVGSISFARLVGRWRAPEVDLTTVEYPVEDSDVVWVYRGVSATTVSRKLGFRFGLLVFALDFAKGLLPTLWVRMAWPDQTWYLVVGILLVVGHVWPLWHGFVGGRGQSTAVGSVLAVNPVILPVAALVGAFTGLLLFTSAHVARQGFGLYMWVWPLVTDGAGVYFWFGLALSFVYFLAIRPDLREERRVKEATGIPESYVGRLQLAWSEFTSTED